MATWTERLQNPLKTLENARYKAGLAYRAFRKNFGKVDPWIEARNKRKLVVDYGPAYIFLEPTNACNLKCPYCPTGVGLQNRKRGLLKMDLVRKIVGELRHKPIQFGFWLAGEPMIHPEIVDMVRIAADAGLKPGMHSNATKLTPEISRGLIEAGLDWISFSFDGDNKADYERMRAPAVYEETVANIQAFLRIRDEMKSATPRVTLQTLIPYENEAVHPYGARVDVSPEFRKLFTLRPGDQLKALLAHAWSGQLDGYTGVAPLHKDTGIRWNCIIPWRDMTIAFDGKIVSCCGDLDAKNVIDDVSEKNLYDVWNGPQFQKFRHAMLTNEIEKWPLCGGCDRIWTEKPGPLDYDLKMEMLRFRLKM